MQTVAQLQDDSRLQRLKRDIAAATECVPSLRTVSNTHGLSIESYVCGSVVEANAVPEGKWKVSYMNEPTFSSIALSSMYEFVGVIRYRPEEVVFGFGVESISFLCNVWLLNKLLDELQPLGNGRSAADQAALAEFTAAARAL
jgi:hypothetical protein